MTLSDAVIIALISGFVQIIIAFFQNRTKSIQNERKEASKEQYINDVIERFDERLDHIEKKVDEHNHYAQRFESVDIRTTKIEKDIEYLKDRR